MNRGGVGYLEIEPGAGWNGKLRAGRGRVAYVTFTLNASLGTTVNVGGATIAIQPTQREGAYAAIMSGKLQAGSIDWQPLNHEVPLLPFGGMPMATLDVVTVKIDRSAQRWTIWFRDALVAEDLPLIPGRDGAPARIAITTGDAGAWLCGLVCADENPLFEDRNDNGVPDDFEIAVLGQKLELSAEAEVVAVLRAAWAEEKLTRPPAEFVLTTPLPDVFPEWCEPEGAPFHGMPDSLRFGGAGPQGGRQ